MIEVKIFFGFKLINKESFEMKIFLNNAITTCLLILLTINFILLILLKTY